MPKPVIMPKLGFTQESSEIVRWLKQPGEEVEEGDPIVEVTTDKVNMEVEAPATGILDGLAFHEGDTVPVTEIIAYIRSANEPPMGEPANAKPAAAASPQPAAPQPAAPAPRETPPSGIKMTEPGIGAGPSREPTQGGENAPSLSPRASPVAARLAQERGVDLNRIAGTGAGGQVTRHDVETYIASQPVGTSSGKVRAAPGARRIARELGIDLSQVRGTGPRGRVQSPDVRAAQTAPRPAPASPAPLPAPAPAPSELDVVQTIPLTGMRQTIATRMQRSAQEAPHITLDVEIDATAAQALLSRANARLENGQPRVTLTAVLVKASAWALVRHPMMNSRLDGQQILLLRDVNVGVAVALEQGLIVPVVRAADRKGLVAIGGEIVDKSERARTNRLKAEDITGGTFTISNLGMFGVDRFTAIINPPESAILAVGRLNRRIVPDDEDRPVVRPFLTLTLSADHRVVDGATAARFLADLRRVLEDPDLLIM